MRLHRFFINKKIENDFFKVADTRVLDQWLKVLRYKSSDKVIIFDGSGYDFDCIIEKIGKSEAILRVVGKRNGLILEKEITLFQSIIKKDKIEWVVEKATELGVSRIIPVVSDRSEKKNLNLERIKKILVEASEQCGRSNVPEISDVMKLKDCFKENIENTVVFDPSGFDFGPLTTNLKNSSFNFFIGPEGGWSDKEMEMFKNLNIPIYSLGPLTLRAETASIVSLVSLKLFG